MPREITHWQVLAQATAQLHPSKQARTLKCLKEYSKAAQLGAMAHDAGYYRRFGRDDVAISVSEVLHGKSGNDSFAPLIQLAQEIERLDDSPLKSCCWAFLLGMVSHYVADTHFHPMIFYFTGDYYHPEARQRKNARTRHRLFEVYLDSWFANQTQLPASYPKRIPRLLLGIAKHRRGLSEVLDRGLAPAELLSDASLKDKTKGFWISCLKSEADFQDLFVSPIAGFIFRMVDRFMGHSLRDLDALFNYKRRTPFELLKDPLRYQNPVTGASVETTVSIIKEYAVLECAKMFQLFEPILRGELKADTAIGHIHGKSLNAGVSGASVSDFRYFAPHGLPLPGLEF